MNKSKRKISKSILINASGNLVWSVISTPGILKLCHPFCEKNNVTSWGSEQPEDSIIYYNGLVLKRVFTKWIDGSGYDLNIINEGNPIASVLWRISQHDDEGGPKLSITIEPNTDLILKKWPAFLRGLIILFYFKPQVAKYLDSVLLGFKFFIETGLNVQKNQFGYHPMFSTSS